MRRIRLTAVLTHPVQYYSPWFRHVAAHAPEIDLTVLYATEPTGEQQGTGFGRAFQWDVPLRDGYRSTVVRPAQHGDRVDSESFFGLDVKEIGPAIEASTPDVVLVPGWHSITLVRAILAARRLNVPVLFRGDTNLNLAPAGIRGRIWRFKTRRLLALFDVYLSPGRRVREYLQALDVDPWQIVDTPHIVDNARFAESARPFQSIEGRAAARATFGIAGGASVLLFAGKLEAKKRPLDLIRAAAQLQSPATVLIVGTGELENTCRAEAARLGVDAVFAGFLNQSELGAAYAAADMLVLPSDARETWGLVVNEALATGLPVVVSDQAGCAPDLVDDTTGAAFPGGDVAALADAIESVRRRASRFSYSDACRKRAEEFDLAAATAGLVRACRQAARLPGAPRVVACCGNMVTIAGLERMTFTVLRGVIERGGRVHCIVNSWENRRIAAMADGIGATWSEGGHEGTIRRRNLTLKQLVAMARDIRRSSMFLWRAARRMHATHVLVPDHLSPIRNVYALARVRLSGRRVIMHLNNAPEAGLFYWWYWRCVINLLVDRFVCISDYTMTELQRLGVSPRKTERIYNALRFPSEPPRPFTAPDAHRIVYAGQIIPVKGLDLLLEAVSELNTRGIPATLMVAGDVDGWTTRDYRAFRQALKSRAAASDLAGKVEFLGWRNDIVEVMASGAVHCAPSRPEQREAFGLVNLEAKRACIPSVVFPTGALPEVITHKEDGWVCSDASVAALVEGLEYFLRDAGRRDAAGRSAFESLKRFDIETADQAWAAIFSTPAPPSSRTTAVALETSAAAGVRLRAVPGARSLRLTVVMTDAVQDGLAWLRHVELHAHELQLTLVGMPPARTSSDSAFFDRDIARVRDAARVIIETQPDVLVLPGWQSPLIERAIAAARHANVPVLLWGHQGLDASLANLGARARWRVKRALARFDGHLNPGSLRARFEALGVDPWQIVDAPYTGDHDAATQALVVAARRAANQPANAPRIVVCCGNMVTVTGLERMTFSALSGLRTRGARVHCIVNSWENHRIVALAQDIGATWSEGGHRGSIRRHNLTPRRILGMVRDIWISSAALWRSARRVRASHVLLPDHLSPIRNVFSLVPLRLLGTRVIMRLPNAPDDGLFYWLYWRCVINPLVDLFVCNSNFTLGELQGLGIAARKTRRIYNALRAPSGSPKPMVGRAADTIIYVGQIIPVKGLEVMLEAVSVLRRRGIPARVQVVGDIDGWTTPEYRIFRDRLKERAAQPDLAGHVEFLGWREDVLDLMAAASVHCAPSLPEQKESFAGVNLQAKHAGLPTVSFNSGAQAEVVTHLVDGWICPEVSAESLADGLSYFLTDLPRREAAGIAAFRSLAKFDVAVFDDAWSEVFSRPAAARAPSVRISRIEGQVAAVQGEVTK